MIAESIHPLDATGLKIRVITPDFPPIVSGLGDYTAHMVRELQSRGHHITLVTRLPTELVAVAGIRHIMMTHWGFISAWKLFQSAHDEGEDVISIQYVPHAYGKFGWAIGFCIAAALARIRLGLPIAITLHEVFTDWSPSPRICLLALVHRLQLLLISAAATEVIVITEGQRQLLKPYRQMLNKDFHVVPCGATIPVYEKSSQRDKLRRQLAPANEMLLGSFALTADPEILERQQAIVSALRSQGQPVRLILLGGQSHSGKREAEWVSSTGTLSSQELSLHLQVLNIFLHFRAEGPTTRNSSLISAMAHSLPCVAFPCRYIEETLFWKNSGIDIVPDTDDAIEWALQRLLNHEPRRRQNARMARRFFEQNFLWTRLAAHVESIFVAMPLVRVISRRKAA